MQVIITAKSAMDKGIWNELCEMKGINPWAVNEGLMRSDDEIPLLEEEARKLGLLR